MPGGSLAHASCHSNAGESPYGYRGLVAVSDCITRLSVLSWDVAVRIGSCLGVELDWSGRRDSNPRHQPWQGCTLPAELLPLNSGTSILPGRVRPVKPERIRLSY